MLCCACAAVAQEPWTQGTKSLLYLRVAFPDDLNQPVSESTALQHLTRANVMFQEQSLGLLSITGSVTSLLILPQPKSHYTSQPPLQLMEDARAVARQAGYEPDDYDLDLARFNPVPGYDFAGTSSVGAKNLWLQHPSFGVLVHELGHNLGMHHSSLWRTSDGSVAGPGDNTAYQDVFDTMGQPESSPEPYHFNVFWKTHLNWLSPNLVPQATNSGTYRIHAYDNLFAGSSHLRGLRVRKDAARQYWLSHRQRIPGNDWLQHGVVMHWNPWAGSHDDTQLLDATPQSPAGAEDAPLLVGRTFSDWEAAVHITPLARGQTGNESWVDVYVHLENPENNSLPVVELDASELEGEVGHLFTLTATATDEDGDSLVYSWDFGDGTIAPSEPQVVHQWTLPGEYVVRCRVSDRRGGAASADLLVTVGEPSSLRISGAVLAGGGTPLEDVLVQSASGRQTRTDSTGRYRLTGLTAGSHTLTASHPGYQFQPGFSNPVQLMNNQEGLDFLADPLPPVIDLQPKSAVVERGQTLILSVTASGLAPIRYQWQRNQEDIPAATESSLALEDIQPEDAGNYRVITWNDLGTNTSAVAAISVTDPPAPPRLLSQPEDVVVNLGDNAVFSFDVEGRQPMMIQWQTPRGQPEDATNATLTVEGVQEADAGFYVAIVINDDGFVITSNALLVVNHPPVPAATTWERLPGEDLSIPIAALLGFDQDDDSLALMGFDSTTQQGGSLIQEAEFLRYNPPAGSTVNDQFSYTVTDGRGGLGVGVATITLFPESARPANVAVEHTASGDVLIAFTGDSQRSYSVVHADEIDATEWLELGTAEHLGGGFFSFTDPAVGGTPPARYYRLRYP